MTELSYDLINICRLSFNSNSNHQVKIVVSKEDKSVLVSIIICTHNRSKYLNDCLESIFSQNYRNFEIIVVDDGPSTDDTTAVLSRYSVVVVKPGGLVGPARARNMGIKVSKGKILAFIDDDSIADKEWLDTIVGKFGEDESIKCVGGKAITYGTNKAEFMNGTVDMFGRSVPINEVPQEFWSNKGNIYNNVVGTNFAVDAASMKSIGGFDEYYSYYYEDTDIAIRIIKSGFRTAHEPRSIVWHAHASGPYRSSKWDQNWYIINRNVAYFSLKNFGYEMSVLQRSTRPICVYALSLIAFIVPFLRGEIPVHLMFRIYKDVTRGFIDGSRDGKKATRRT